MAITNLQQARQMYQTGQRVAKTLDGSRPGYRGEGAYQGGSGKSKASSSTNKGPAGGATIGSGSKQSGSPKARNTSTTPRDTNPTDINDNRLNYRTSTPYVTSVKPEDVARSKLQFIQKLNNDNAIRANQLGTKFVPYQGGSRPKPKSGLAGLLMGGLGMLMGIPGLGLVTGGLRNLGTGIMNINNRIQQSDFGRSKNLMDYLDMKKFGGYDERELAREKRMQEAKDLQAAMMLRPSATMTPRDYAMQGLTVPDLGDVSSLIEATTQGTDRGLLEAPGDNLPVLNTSPNRNINYNRIQGYTDEYPNLGAGQQLMEEVVESNTIPTINGVPMIDTGSVYDNLNEDPYTYPAETTSTISLGGYPYSSFMESQIDPAINRVENRLDLEGKPIGLVDERIRDNMYTGLQRGYLGPGFSKGGIASL